MRLLDISFTFRLTLLVLVCGPMSGWSQAVLSDLERTGAAADLAPFELGVLLYRYLPAGDRTGITTTEDLLRRYRPNPYLWPLVSDSSHYRALRTLALDRIRDTVRVRSARDQRDRYLQSYARDDLYDLERKLDLGLLRQAYQTPTAPLTLALQQSATIAQQSAGGEGDYFSIAIAGLSDWIQRRAQEEFTIAFLTRLEEYILTNHLQALFPASTRFFTTIDISDYKSFLPDARVAFINDLQALTFNVAGYLRATGALDNADPRVYNLLLIYELLDLSARGLDLPEVIGFARGELQRQRFAAERQLHLRVAGVLRDSLLPADYTLLSELDQAVQTLYSVADGLGTQRTELGEASANLRSEQEVVPGLDLRLDRFTFSDVATQGVVPLFLESDGRNFLEAADLLRGEIPYAERRAKASLAGYRQLFDQDAAIGPDTLQAMGLTMLRALLRRNGRGEFVLVDRLQQFADTLDLWADSLTLYRALIAGEPPLTAEVVSARAVELQERIRQSLAYWDTRGITRHERESLLYLADLAAAWRNRYPERFKENLGLFLDSLPPYQLTHLEAVEDLLEERIESLENTYLLSSDPTQTVAPPVVRSREQVFPLRRALERLEAAYRGELEKWGGNRLRVYENAGYFEQILGVGSELFFFLTESRRDGLDWVPANELSRLLSRPEERDLLQGLLHQRLTNGPLFDTRLAPRGLTDLASSLTLALQQLGQNLQDTTLRKSAARVGFVAQVLNDILETPIMTQPGRPGLYPLTQVYAPLARVPAVNRQLTELFTLTSSGRYRQAITPLLELVDLFNIVPDSSARVRRLANRQQRYMVQRAKLLERDTLTPAARDSLAATIQKIARLDDRLTVSDQGRYQRRFRRYGSFIAGIAAAENTYQIQAVLDAAALPPGSSRNKRLYSFNVELNAYFGGAGGREYLLGDLPDGVDRSRGTAGLFVPVGLSVTQRIVPNRQWSATLFLPLIDIGAVTAYRSGNDVDAIPKVTLGNLLAPGAHLLLNLPNSPFFIGYGWQFGPNERRIGEENYSAYRQLVTFGIDVPIFSFARRR